MRKVKKIHFREKNEDYIKGLIAGKYRFRQGFRLYKLHNSASMSHEETL